MASVIEEIKSMQNQGMSEDKIISSLRERGVPHKDILDALSRTKIKAAVESSSDEPQNFTQEQEEGVQDRSEAPIPSELQTPEAMQSGTQKNPTEGMQKSILSENGEENDSKSQPASQEMSESQDYNYGGQQYYDYPQQGESQGYDGDYGGYSGYGSNLSSDVVSEISEQVVSEKIAEIRKGVEKILDFKTTMEAKVEGIGERLKRIEKIIDTLQASVLRKTGDYVNNVDDIKKELIETQKTFSKLLPEFRKEIDKGKKSKGKK